jgi:membrane protein YqaA with SNARE-associated domain
MAQLAQRPATISNPLIGLALAASLLGGIAGGAVAVAVPAVIQARADDVAAQAAESAKWQKYAEDWERRYGQMYPTIDQS